MQKKELISKKRKKLQKLDMFIWLCRNIKETNQNFDLRKIFMQKLFSFESYSNISVIKKPHMGSVIGLNDRIIIIYSQNVLIL